MMREINGIISICFKPCIRRFQKFWQRFMMAKTNKRTSPCRKISILHDMNMHIVIIHDMSFYRRKKNSAFRHTVHRNINLQCKEPSSLPLHTIYSVLLHVSAVHVHVYCPAISFARVFSWSFPTLFHTVSSPCLFRKKQKPLAR